MIPIQNIFHMLAYAFKILKSQGYRNLSQESFSNISDLMAAIIIKGVSSQIKQGLRRDYIDITKTSSSVRGKLDVTKSVKYRTLNNKQTICTYDDFSTNIKMNQILKTTMNILASQDIERKRKKELYKLLMYFQNVDFLEPNKICWNFRYDRNNQTYQMLMNICYLIIKGMLIKQQIGNLKVRDFIDEQRMSSLYERFIFEYYKKEFPNLRVSAPYIRWNLDDDFQELLPTMKSDIVLSNGEKTLIIDAKYYKKSTQEYYDAKTLHSHNLYQIFTYVKNYDIESKGDVMGLLLYAKTQDDYVLNHFYKMSGNEIAAKTLDLNCEFSEIQVQLNGIIKEIFL
ncbi:MAG: 5-methylcytosine-specific restriction endonuclease system specificity protein McrC [Clostridiaceae bacterium]|nr:5-methylcytosine-specific restriction endonuclease system specificity protein McrC [Clostridiaceae bacterium]